MLDPAAAVASNMEALTEQYRTITQNLANANTSGFKRHCTSFATALAAAGQVSSKISSQDKTDFSQGHLMDTGRNLDLAIGGKGFFVVDTPQGEVYTRGGVFSLNAQGQLIDFSGSPVAGDRGPITLPGNASVQSLKVSSSGDVTADGKSLGKLKIVEFDDPSKLVALGNCCFQAPQGVDAKTSTTSSVHQGFQEASNVSLVGELVDLIKVSRLYEANAKSITTQDDRGKSLLRVAMG